MTRRGAFGGILASLAAIFGLRPQANAIEGSIKTENFEDLRPGGIEQILPPLIIRPLRPGARMDDWEFSNMRQTIVVEDPNEFRDCSVCRNVFSFNSLPGKK